jgi:hypothetical protein
MGISRMSSAGSEFIAPLGMRDDDGNIVPLVEGNAEEDIDTSPDDATLFKGVKERVPRHVGQLVSYIKFSPIAYMFICYQNLPATKSENLTQTQRIDECTQRVELPSRLPPDSSSSPTSPEPPTPPVRRVTRSRAKVFSSDTLPPSDPTAFSVPSDASFREETVDTQILKEELMGRGDVDEYMEMLGESTHHSYTRTH